MMAEQKNELADEREDVKAIAQALADVEKRLAELHGIRRKPIRLELLRLIKAGQIDEDDLLAEWHRLYATLMELSRLEAADADNNEKAASAAFSFPERSDELPRARRCTLRHANGSNAFTRA